MDKIQEKEVRIISSELTLMEALVLPLRNRNRLLIDTYEQLFARVELVPISQTLLKRAAQLRATTRLKTPDAIHAATAQSSGCTLFLTNDRGFRNVPTLPVTILSEVLQA
ncbi:MAG: PIN domain-containing protein [Cyanobacteriota bacterium]|nr:PIN domain-containing protein [Cyanobacteriota bacterium]